MSDTELDLDKCRVVATSCVAGNLRQASRAVSQLYDEAIRPSGLRGPQFTLLVALAIAGLSPITNLAEALVMDRTTLSRNLKPLAQRGWVKIAPGADQRQRMVSLTSTGEAVLATALPLWEQAQRQLVNGLGDAGFADLLAGLATAVSTVKAS